MSRPLSPEEVEDLLWEVYDAEWDYVIQEGKMEWSGEALEDLDAVLSEQNDRDYDPDLDARDLCDYVKKAAESEAADEWTTGIYYPTPRFRGIEAHACVCRASDQGLIAVCGPAGDPESEKEALLFAAAPRLLALLEQIADDLGNSMEYLVSDIVQATVRTARAAIAEATGREDD